MGGRNMIFSSYLEKYISEHHFENAQKALKLMLELLDNSSNNNRARFEADFEHSLYIVRMLLDLHMPLKGQEKDVLLAAAICHNLTESYIVNAYEMMSDCQIDKEACDVLMLIGAKSSLEEEELKQHYLHLQQNKLALMIELCDRGSILHQLHEVSSWQARQYIYETKIFYFPMCIYGKENYIDLFPCISIVMEKMRNLIQLAEIMLDRYETREKELIGEVLEMREENATIRGIIKRLEAEM